MTHPETACVSLCREDDMKGEEVQVHPGIKHWGCLAHTQTSVHIHTHTQTHPPHRTNTHSRTHTRCPNKCLTQAASQPVHPAQAVKKQSFPLQLNSSLTIIESALSSEFIEFHFTAVFLLFFYFLFYTAAFCFIGCVLMFDTPGSLAK